MCLGFFFFLVWCVVAWKGNSRHSSRGLKILIRGMVGLTCSFVWESFLGTQMKVWNHTEMGHWQVTSLLLHLKCFGHAVGNSCSSILLLCLKCTELAVKARLDGASFRAPAQATLHLLMHASWCKSRASLAAYLLLFRHYWEAHAECLYKHYSVRLLLLLPL